MIPIGPAHPSRIRLFRNRWMELTTLTPFPLFLPVWLLVLAAAAAIAAREVRMAPLLLAVPAGLLFWTLFEYVAHRFVFHLELRSEWGRRLVFLLHENHHQDPADPLRSIMPLTVSLPMGAAIWGAALLAFGGIGHALFLGFALGYVGYDTVHWACHQLPMRGRVTARLKRHHLRHHYAGQDTNYAITAIFWDRVFGSGLTRR